MYQFHFWGLAKLYVKAATHFKCECEVEVERIHEGLSAAYISVGYVKENSVSPGE